MGLSAVGKGMSATIAPALPTHDERQFRQLWTVNQGRRGLRQALIDDSGQRPPPGDERAEQADHQHVASDFCKVNQRQLHVRAS